MAPILGYWDIRGLAAPIRYLLECAGSYYEEKLYKCGPPPSFDRSEWAADKFELGLDFPNLPYYLDGDVKLSQSGVIMRYLAKKHGFWPKNENDMLRVELLEAQIYDYRIEYARLCYNPSFLSMKDDYIKGLPDKMNLLSKFLGDRKYAVGDYLTYVDFILFEYLEVQSNLVDDLLKDYPILDQFQKRIMEIEEMKTYFQADRCIKYPFNGAPALYGGDYSEELSKQN